MAETDWQGELWELVRKLKEHFITLKQYNTEKKKVSDKAPNSRLFREEEQRLFRTALDQEASAEVINAGAEGLVFRKSRENAE